MAEFGYGAMDEYDAYHLWLGIPPDEQPPSHYRLLGVRLFEQNAEVIRNAADRQRAHVKRLGINQYEKRGQDLLNDIEAAKICLLKPEKRKLYDERLKAELQREADGDRHGTYEEQLSEETLIVGSDRHCDIVIDLPIISGIHCSVMRRAEKVILRDLKSTNGTYLNFTRVVRPSKVTPSDLIILGRDTRLKLPTSFFPASLRGQRVGFVGRSDQCEVCIPDHTVSSFHARILFDNATIAIEDLNSTNGTSLIDARGRTIRLPPRVPTELADIEHVNFGKHQMSIDDLRRRTSFDGTWVEK
ncbi:MAG: FHA domain-containing protein [Pirellulaceae bacterium]|jgi:pSer/pThr/pTyr-binding forkhead associated (FHA) protein